MMKKIAHQISKSFAALLFFVAVAGAVKPFCVMLFYEPDIPEALKNM